MDLEWVRAVRNQCVEAGVPFFLRQLGGEIGRRGWDEAVLDGQLWHEMPSYNVITPAKPPEQLSLF
jgi:protein gp37